MTTSIIRLARVTAFVCGLICGIVLLAASARAERGLQALKISSGSSAETVTFGTSTTLETRRSTATLHST